MTRPTGERALLVLAGLLLAAAVLAHVPYILSGTQTFWIAVTASMSVFCLVSSAPIMGWGNAIAFAAIGYAFGLFFETMSVHTGFPFGPYYYTDVFGPGVFGVPFIIPLAWYVITYLAYGIANLMIEQRPIVSGGVGQSVWLSIVGAAVVTAYDLSLDPFMVTKVKAWVMTNPGNYFGEQFRGFAGWMLTAFCISATFRLTRRGLPRAAGAVAPLAVAYPLAAYALWGIFFAFAGEPPGTRPIAIFAMGIPVLTAASGFVKWRRAAASLVLVLVLAGRLEAQGGGSIAGRVTQQDGAPLTGVVVAIQETGSTRRSDADGRYRFDAVAPGTYTLLLSLGRYSETKTVAVAAGDTTAADVSLDWPLTFVETISVSSASRHLEPLAEAPAAITTLDAAEIARQSASGQLPLLLAGAPGVQVVQSGLYDFNINARGFNDMTNRRVRTEIDGRDSSMPQVTGYTDWASIAFGLDELDQVEFLRGPGGALYGLGALNGVLSLRTKAPADSLGGRARFTVGALDTVRVDARQAVALGQGWFLKAVGGYQRSADFARSRVGTAEYAPGLLPLEAVPLARDRATLAFGSARLDKQLSDGGRLSVEGGTVSKAGQVTLTNLGRYQANDSTFPWVRGAFESPAWNVLAAYTSADINDQLSLSAGQGTFQAAYNVQIDAHRNGRFAAARGHWVGGASYSRQHVDSANPQGIQTNYEHPESADGASAFGQIDYRFADRLKATFAGRIDASSLSRTTASPRAAVVYELSPTHAVRVAFSRAYKAPTIAERRLRAPIAPPADLSALERALAPLLGGATLGFSSIPVLAVGNDALDVEAISSAEAGYHVLLGGRTFLQATYYRNHVDTFTSGLMPQIGTSLGRLNPSFGPYRVPPAVSPAAAAVVYAALAALPPSLAGSLSNLPDGSPVFAVLSLANFGRADTQGLELSATAHLKYGWRVDASYAWFDFGIDAAPPDVPLLPNTPRHQGAVGVAYIASRFDAGVRARFVDGFRWVSGIYAGPVPAYTVVDVQANHPVNARLAIGLDVSNVLDRAHYEMFGGDLLRRRALAHTTVSW